MVKGLDTFQKYFADYEEQYVLIGVKVEKQVSELEEIGCVVLELGYFIDFLGKGFQDPLSVVLSLTGEEQEEERVDISINEMLEEYVWSKD